MNGFIRAINLTRGTVLCARLEKAGGLSGQTRGLLGREALGPDEGMLFEAGRLSPFMWMHMFFMRFPIDIVFLDRHDTVLKIDHTLRPWRVSSLVFKAAKALEIAPGAARRSETEVGDQIELEAAS